MSQINDVKTINQVKENDVEISRKILELIEENSNRFTDGQFLKANNMMKKNFEEEQRIKKRQEREQTERVAREEKEINNLSPTYSRLRQQQHRENLQIWITKNNVEQKRPDLENKLINAIKEGDIDNIKLFIERGANVEEAVCMVCRSENRELLFIILSFIDIKQNQFNAKTKKYIIEWAVANGDIEFLEILINAGFDIKNNERVLCVACANNRVEIVRLLLKKGAKVNANDNYPLRCVCEKGYLELLELLVEYGVDITANFNYGIKSAKYYKRKNIYKYLIKKGIKKECAKIW